MSRSVNEATIIGILGRDPDVRVMPDGKCVANVSIATDESYVDKQSGLKVEQTEWHRVTAYGKIAEIMQQYLKKGSKVYIQGKLRTHSWEKEGITRHTTSIIANRMLMLNNRMHNDSYGMPNNLPGAPDMHQRPAPAKAPQGGCQQPAPQNQPAHTSAPQPANGFDGFDGFDDDVSF